MAGLRNEEKRPMAAEASANAVFQSYALLPHMSVAGTSPSASRCRAAISIEEI